jgi:hypothetical protein
VHSHERFDHSRASRVGDVDIADVVFLAVVGAPGEWFIQVLESGAPHEGGIIHDAAKVMAIHLGPRLLIGCGNQANVEHPAVECAEMELGNDGRFVQRAREFPFLRSHVRAVDIQAHRIAILRGRRDGFRRAPGEPAAKIEMIGVEFVRLVADNLGISHRKPMKCGLIVVARRLLAQYNERRCG